MTKKILIFLSLLCTMVLTSGCVKYNVIMDIDRNNNIKFFQTAIVDTELIKEKLKEPNFDVYANEHQKEYSKDLRGKGYLFEGYKDYPYEGIKAFKKIKIKKYAMDSLPKGYSLYPEEGGVPVAFIKTPFKTTYTVHFKFNADSVFPKIEDKLTSVLSLNQKDEETIENAQNTDETKSKSEFSPVDEVLKNERTDMKFVMKIPAKALEHNADKVIDDKTYEWNLAKKGDVEIKLIYEQINYLSYIFLFGLLFGTFWFVFTHERYKPRREDDYIPSSVEHHIPHHEEPDEIMQQDSKEE